MEGLPTLVKRRGHYPGRILNLDGAIQCDGPKRVLSIANSNYQQSDYKIQPPPLKKKGNSHFLKSQTILNLIKILYKRVLTFMIPNMYRWINHEIYFPNITI